MMDVRPPRPPLTKTRKMILFGLGVFVAAVAAFSLAPLPWTGELRTPPSAGVQTVEYHCSGAWTPFHVTGPAKVAYPIEDTPCGDRRRLQVISVLDVALAGAAAWFLVFRRSREPAE